MLFVFVSSFLSFPFIKCLQPELVKVPKDWREATKSECNKNDSILDVGEMPKPYGIFGDELDPTSDFYFLGNQQAQRRIYNANGVILKETTKYPFTSICSIMEKNDAYQWCTCTIISDVYILTFRDCFRNRPLTSLPTANIPDIKIKYGSNKKSKHEDNRTIVAMYNHPNTLIPVTLMKVNVPMRFGYGFRPLAPDKWLKTTGYRNYIPKCSTFTCAYGNIETESATDDLKCIFYRFTTNLQTLIGTGWSADKKRANYTRAWLTSVHDYPEFFGMWLQGKLPEYKYKGRTNHEIVFPSICAGDPGAPLIYYDRRKDSADPYAYYLLGIMADSPQRPKCGVFGVDMAVSMISLVGWLAEYIEDIKNPRLGNQHKPPKAKKWPPQGG